MRLSDAFYSHSNSLASCLCLMGLWDIGSQDQNILERILAQKIIMFASLYLSNIRISVPLFFPSLDLLVLAEDGL